MLSFYNDGIAEAIEAVQERISSSAIRAGRDPGEIKLVAVSKTVDLPRIIEAIRSGVSILGENRVQEARGKIAEFMKESPGCAPEWHLIGHLQRNKAKYAVSLFELIHTVDSIPLAEELNKQAARASKRQRILIQVKLSEEAAKHGVREKNLMELLERVSGLENLKLEGLMLMPPFFENPEEARPYFRMLREIRDEAERRGFCLPELSMGMSGDFEVAIEEGATLLRIGTAIFGRRPVDR